MIFFKVIIFREAIQTDGYKVYDYFESVTGIVLLTCMAHIRRKFIEAQKSHPVQAANALEYIATLYMLEEKRVYQNSGTPSFHIQE